MKKSIKTPIFCLLFTSLMLAGSLLTSNKSQPVLADNDVTTDMSSVALLDGEKIDTNNIIYDDFSNGNLTANWTISHRKWGGYDNKGVSSENVFLDNADQKLVIRALGNQHITTSTVDGVGGPLSGGAVVLKQTARPGRYEVRMKPAYRVGVCNAFWTYTDDYQGNNHEIDIEFPFKDNSNNNSYDEVIFTNYIGESNYQQTHTTLDYYLNDGEYHTFCFDWYYSNNHKVINYYIDSILLATHKVVGQLPYLPSRLWLGCWIPNNPYFVGVPNFDECYMEIDYFKYSPFLNQESVTQGGAGGAGNSVFNYQFTNQLPAYDWLSNGSFDAIDRSDDITARGYEVDGTVRLYSGYDRNRSYTSGGAKLSPNTTISYKVDSTYGGYKYYVSLYRIGNAQLNIEFYNRRDGLISNLTVESELTESWDQFIYNYTVPKDSFYTIIKFKNTGNVDLYLDDMSLIMGEYKEDPIDPPTPPTPPVEPEKVKITSLSIEQKNIELKVGESITLVAIYSPEDVDEINLVWGSENAGIAIVNNGLVKAQKEGTTNIVVVDLVTNLSAKCQITVKGSVQPEIKIGCGGEMITSSLILSLIAATGTTLIVIKKKKTK